MGSLMRSEEMVLYQLFLQSESAYTSVSELGELGLVQFRDLNPDVNIFSRKFVNEVRRCDEMERKLRYIEKEIKKDQIPVLDTGDNPDAPAPREMIDLEASFEKLENELREVNSNAEALKKNFLELTELKHILRKTQQFFDEHERSIAEDAQEALVQADQLENQQQTLHLGFVAGVILRERVPTFERLLWRACRGNVFLKQVEIDAPLEDPVSGDEVRKCVFVIFFQGDQLKTRVKKICEGFRATLYPCPESAAERREMSMGVMTRIEDLNIVLRQTTDHRRRVLVLAAKNIKNWFIKVRKIKAIYHTLNMFNLDVTQKCLIAECWCATADVDKVHMALRRGQEKSGSAVPSILNRMATSQKPPTFNRTNKVTAVYQALIDAYGVSSYREINPAPFSMITFPFLFSVMFGDFGHGIVMFLIGLWMVLREKPLLAKKSDNEMWNLFFGGRYLILMMGAFSIYAGLLYNDVFSKSINIFGSKWKATNESYSQDYIVKGAFTTQILNPDPYVSIPWSNAHNGSHSKNDSLAQFQGSPYPFGLDPIWAISSNKLTFVNSFKMKMSVIFGVVHMLYGIMLSLLNHIHFSNYINIFCEFIPQVLFLCCSFFYLVIMIVYKWIVWSSRATNGVWSTSCSPNLLIGMINMFLFTGQNFDPTSDTHDDFGQKFNCEPSNSIWGSNGVKINYILVGTMVICIPWILIPKPYLLWRRGYAKKHVVGTVNGENGVFGDQEVIIHHDELQPRVESDSHEEESISDIVVHQAIHTIEYCLGCISHTASYLRLWALSLAHGQLSEVLWTMVLSYGLSANNSYVGAAIIVLVFPFWCVATVVVLLAMEGLSAFLHTLRLHWVEFNSKFYKGDGYAFVPFTFATILDEGTAATE